MGCLIFPGLPQETAEAKTGKWVQCADHDIKAYTDLSLYFYF